MAITRTAAAAHQHLLVLLCPARYVIKPAALVLRLPGRSLLLVQAAQGGRELLLQPRSLLVLGSLLLLQLPHVRQGLLQLVVQLGCVQV
jgi:hypothetical protein